MAKKDGYGFLATALAYPIVMADLAVEKVVNTFSREDKIKKIRKESLIEGREIDPETECGILEVKSKNSVYNAIENNVPVVRIIGKEAKSIVKNINTTKGEKNISTIGTVVGVTTMTIALPVGAILTAGSLLLGSKNNIKNINKYESVIESEDSVLFRCKEFKKK